MSNNAVSGQRSQHIENSQPIAGTSYQNMRADEIIKKYHHSNTEVQQKAFSARAHGTVSPRQIDFDRNIGTAVGNLNNSYMAFSDTLM